MARWKLSAWADDQSCKFPDKKSGRLARLKIYIGMEEHEKKTGKKFSEEQVEVKGLSEVDKVAKNLGKFTC